MGSRGDKEGLRRDIAEQERVVRETAEATDDATLVKRGVALFTLGEDLLRLGDFAQAATRLDEAATVLWPFESERGTAINARERRANALAYLRREQDALGLVESSIDEIGLDWIDPNFPDVIPRLLCTRSKLLWDRGRRDEADAAADETLAQLGSVRGPSERLIAITVLCVKARVAYARDQTSRVFELLDKVIESCTDEDGEEFAPCFADALVMRAQALIEARYLQEALADCEQVLTRCGSDPDPEVRRNVAWARTRRKQLRRAMFKLRLLRATLETRPRQR